MWIKHKCWIYVILWEFFQLAHSASLRCLYNDISLTRYVEAPMNNGRSLIKTGCLDINKRTMIYIFGYGGALNGSDAISVASAAVPLDDLNVILLNWEKEASSTFITSTDPISKDIKYVISGVPAAYDVGKQLGNAIVSMSRAGLDLEKTFVVGHSLGAQVAAQAGRTVKSRLRKLIRVIIGLDPAGPLFGSPTNLPSLASDCASFVYTVTTDPGGYGINRTQTHVDILVNCENFFIETNTEKQVQPGCPVGTFQMFTTEDLCSHVFSWKLFTESLRLFHTLLASKAVNCLDWVSGNEDTSDYVNIGLDIDQTKRGIYCLQTNGAFPYGRGIAGLSFSSA